MLEDNDDMLEEYDFSNARRNPYSQLLKRQISINIDIPNDSKGSEPG